MKVSVKNLKNHQSINCRIVLQVDNIIHMPEEYTIYLEIMLFNSMSGCNGYIVTNKEKILLKYKLR